MSAMAICLAAIMLLMKFLLGTETEIQYKGKQQ